MGLFSRKKQPTLEELIEKAESGDPKDIYEVGYKYEDGEDYCNAAVWYQKGVDLGDADSQFCLGLLYEQGWGVKKDMGKAIELLKLAADQNHNDAFEELHLMAEEGLCETYYPPKKTKSK